MKTPGQDSPSPDKDPQQERDLRFDLPISIMAEYIALLGLTQDLAEKAHIDVLTGLPNRRALEESYDWLQGSEEHRNEEQRRAGDTEQAEETGEHGLLLLDIDYFKDINDLRGGHSAGDKMLKEVADVISERARNDDIVARLGGDEFAVLLPHTTIEQAMKVAEEMRQMAQDRTDITLSVGATGIEPGESFGEGLKKADQALYTAKELGRNQVAQYELSRYHA